MQRQVRLDGQVGRARLVARQYGANFFHPQRIKIDALRLQQLGQVAKFGRLHADPTLFQDGDVGPAGTLAGAPPGQSFAIADLGKGAGIVAVYQQQAKTGQAAVDGKIDGVEAFFEVGAGARVEDGNVALFKRQAGTLLVHRMGRALQGVGQAGLVERQAQHAKAIIVGRAFFDVGIDHLQWRQRGRDWPRRRGGGRRAGQQAGGDTAAPQTSAPGNGDHGSPAGHCLTSGGQLYRQYYHCHDRCL